MNRKFKTYITAASILLLGAVGCKSLLPLTFTKPTLVTYKQKPQAYLDQKPRKLRGVKPDAYVASNKTLDLTVQVGLRNEEELDKILADSSNPNSPNFGLTLTQEEFASRFLPTKEQLDNVKNALVERGMFVDPNYHGATVRAHTNVALAERTFNTRIMYYRDKLGVISHAPDTVVSVDEDLNIISIGGLATPPVRKPRYTTKSAAIPAFSGPYNVAKLRQAYNVPSTAMGAGQSIGVVELDGYKASDIASYARLNGIRQPPLTNILIDGYDGAIINSDAQVEVTLDIQLINAMAPNAAEIRVYSADQQTSDTAFYDIWNEVANPTAGDKKLMKQISCSWGIPEDEMSAASLQADGVLFKQMAIQGQTVFAAAGDSGAYDDGSTLSTDDPASQFWVVGVGGTSLSMSGKAYSGEVAWSNGGGGISKIWNLPPWQKGLANSKNLGSAYARNVPDVSLNADPDTGYWVLVNNRWIVIGGTSCAAPMWSGMAALIGEARVNAKKPPTGFLAPALYSVPKSSYHDVATGTNGYYHAVPGYDNATGLGSFNAASLLQAMTQ